MEKGHAATPTLSNRKTLNRLLFNFLPHSPLFIATVLASAVYAGAMTARVGLIYPLLRLFVQDVPTQQREAMGIDEEFAVVRTVAQSDSRSNAVLARVNAAFDRMDRFWIDFFGYGGSEKEQARFGTLMSILVLFTGVAVAAALSNYLQVFLRALPS
jgi:hypothetical protein